MMTFEEELMKAFDERQKAIEEHTFKIQGLCHSAIEGITSFLKDSGEYQEGCELLIHYIYRIPDTRELMFVGTVRYPIGQVVTDDDGIDTEVTSEIAEHFNHPFQLWVPIDIVAKNDPVAVFNYLKEVEDIIDEQTAQFKEVVDTLFGHPEVFEDSELDELIDVDEEEFDVELLTEEQALNFFSTERPKKRNYN
jgi:hypothetical protein